MRQNFEKYSWKDWDEWKKFLEANKQCFQREDIFSIGLCETDSVFSFPIKKEAYGALIALKPSVKICSSSRKVCNIVIRSRNKACTVNIQKNLEEIINKYFNDSADFLKIDLDFSLSPEIDLKFLEGESYQLSIAIASLLAPLTKFFADEKIKFCFTGKLGNNGKVEEVSGIEEKLIATASCDIDYFFLPKANKKDLIEAKTYLLKLEEKNDNLFLLNRKVAGGDFPLKIILVSNIEETIKLIFKEISKLNDQKDKQKYQEWYKDSRLRKVFDLKYQYQQKILDSDLVKIDNILGQGNKSIDLSKYVELQIIDREEVKKKLQEEREERSLDSILRETSKKAEPILPVEALKKLKDENKLIVIFGAAGAGKTTLLKKLLDQLCKEEIEDLKDHLPVFFEFKSLENQEVIPQFVKELGLDEEVFKSYLNSFDEKKKVVYLLDAFDEATDKEKANKIINRLRSSNKKIILTSRYDPSLSGDDNYEVLPLREEKIEEFVKHYVEDDDKKEKLLQLIKTNKEYTFSNLLTNPLMLTLLVFIVDDKKAPKLLNNPVSIIKDTIDKLCHLLERKIGDSYYDLEDPLKGLESSFANTECSELSKLVEDICELQKIMNNSGESKKIIDNITDLIWFFLERVAYDTFTLAYIDNSKYFKEWRIFFKQLLEKAGFSKDLSFRANRLIKFLTSNLGIIKPLSEERYYFFHRVFHEFLVASYVAKYLTEEKLEEWINKHKFDLQYEPVFEFLAGILDLMAYEEGKRSQNPNF